MDINRKIGEITPFLSMRIREFAAGLIPGMEKARGALLLSDISGFTKMSEALSKLGKAGTEELTMILNDYFDAMIGVIIGFKGDILKFGGDALLVSFYGDPRRQAKKARDCAGKMMAEMEKFRTIKTNAGEFAVEMKIAIASGEWNESVLGDDRRRDLFIDGFAVRKLVLLEDKADRGEVLVGETRGVKGKSGIRRSQKRKAGDLLSFLPKGYKEFRESGIVSEHRAVSVGFVNIDGYDENEPGWAELQELFTRIIAIAEKYKGSVAKINPHKTGSNLMVLFGAPAAYGNDTEHAVLAFMEISNINVPPIKIKAGLESGFVYAGMIGSDLRKEYTVIGDVVNTAERLMETAEEERMIVSESSYRLTADKINYKELSRVTVKGKEKPLRRFAPRTSVEKKVFRFGFIGREWIFKETEKAVKEGGKAIIIRGEAGIGKSRLLYEVSKRFEGTHKVIEGHADELKGALHIYASMIAKEANIHPDDRDDIRKEKLAAHIKAMDKGELGRRISFLGAMLFGITYPGSPYEKADAKLRFENLTDAIRYYIEYQGKPTIVVFDDVQWLTKDDLRILVYVSRILLALSRERGKTTLILAGRPEPDVIDTLPLAEEIGVKRIELSRLEDGEIGRLIAEKLNNKSMPGDVMKIILERTDGNPFYLEQFLLDLIDRRLIEEKENRWEKTAKFKEAEIPLNIFTAIMARVDRLEAKAKEAVSVGSVIGMEFGEKVVERALREPEVSQYLAETETEQITYKRIVKEIEYIFRHAMIKDVIYDSMLRERRRSLHKEVGEAMEGLYEKDLEKIYGLLAYHYYHGQGWDKSIDYNLKAGTNAKKQYQNQQAIKYFSTAARIIEKEMPHKKEELYRAHKESGDVYYSVSSFMSAMECYEKAINVTGKKNDDKVVDGLNGIANARRALGKYAEALRTAEASYNMSRDNKYPRGIAESRNIAGLAHYCQGNYDEALRYFKESLKINQEIEDRTGIIKNLNNIGSVYYYQGRYADAFKCYEESLEIGRRIGNKTITGSSLNNIALLFSDQSRYDKALAYYGEALEIFREMGDKSGIAYGLNNIGVAKRRQGDYDEALKYYEESMEIRREIGDKANIASNLNNIGLVHFSRGDYEKALERYEEAISIRRRIGDQRGLALGLYNKGGACTGQGKFDLARQFYEESMEIYGEINNQLGVASNLSSIGGNLIAHGSYEDGIKKVSEAMNILKAIGAKPDMLGPLASLIYAYAETGNRIMAKESIDAADVIKKETASEYIVQVALAKSKFFEKEGEAAEALKHAEDALEKSDEFKQINGRAEAMVRLCEILWLNRRTGSTVKMRKKIRSYASEAAGIADNTGSMPVRWKAQYWLYKAAGSKRCLEIAKECLKEQTDHIPAGYRSDFKKYVKNYMENN